MVYETPVNLLSTYFLIEFTYLIIIIIINEEIRESHVTLLHTSSNINNNTSLSSNTTSISSNTLRYPQIKLQLPVINPSVHKLKVFF